MHPKVELADVRRLHEEWQGRVAVSHHGVVRANDGVAFTTPSVPMHEARVALVTTAGAHLDAQAPFDMSRVDGDAHIRRLPSDTPSTRIRFTHDHYDHSDADADPNCVFPIDHLRDLAAAGRIGSVAAQHFSASGFLPDPEIFLRDHVRPVVEELREDQVDVALFTGGCPVCMRTVALFQNEVERAGIATASLTVQPLITAGVGTPRAAYVRFPIGNPVGPPHRPDLQRAILDDLLDLVWAAEEPGTLVRFPYRWHHEPRSPRHPISVEE
jgi:glycine/betaine/sarcosine/D-proline reductase family selenoprotein B